MRSYIYAPFSPNFSLGVLNPHVLVCEFLLYLFFNYYYYRKRSTIVHLLVSSTGQRNLGGKKNGICLQTFRLKYLAK